MSDQARPLAALQGRAWEILRSTRVTRLAAAEESDSRPAELTEIIAEAWRGGRAEGISDFARTMRDALSLARSISN